MKLKNRIRKFAVIISVFHLLIASGMTQDLAVKAYLNKTTVGLNQQFTLSLELSGAGANTNLNPELPRMDNFASFLGSGSSQNIQFVNGKMSVSKTISYHYMASTAGKFQIEAISVQHKGKTYKTDPISIEIVQGTPSQQPQTSQRQAAPQQGSGPAEGDLFLRATVNKKKVYQNEPVIVTYKLYTRVDVSSYGFSKLPGTTGFWTESFDTPQRPELATEVLEGKQYRVATLKKMALFPMSAGTKTIDPMGVECEVRVSRKRSRSMFDDFFNDSFFFGRTERKEILSKPVNIQVMPLPSEGKPENYTGVVGQFALTGRVDKTETKTNEAITYKVKISGQGNIRTLPEPVIYFPPDFEVYPPKKTEKIERTGNIISGHKTYEYILVPRIAGLQKIKPIQLSVFDTKARAYKTLSTKEILIDVAKGSDVFSTVPSGLSREEVRFIGQDIRFIKTNLPVFRRTGNVFYAHVLFWMILILPLLCIGMAFAYRRHQNRLYGDVAYARNRRASRVARKRLAGAKSQLDVSSQTAFYAEVQKGLMSYLGDKLNIAESGMISDEVKKTLLDKGALENTIREYFECMNKCDMMRFSPSGSDESEMKGFLKQAESALSRIDKELSK